MSSAQAARHIKQARRLIDSTPGLLVGGWHVMVMQRSAQALGELATACFYDGNAGGELSTEIWYLLDRARNIFDEAKDKALP